jgi:hypothetical protein
LLPSPYIDEVLNVVKNIAPESLRSLFLIFLLTIIIALVRADVLLKSFFEGNCKDKILLLVQFQLYEMGAIPWVNVSALYFRIAINLIMAPP